MFQTLDALCYAPPLRGRRPQSLAAQADLSRTSLNQEHTLPSTTDHRSLSLVPILSLYIYVRFKQASVLSGSRIAHGHRHSLASSQYPISVLGVSPGGSGSRQNPGVFETRSAGLTAPFVHLCLRGPLAKAQTAPFPTNHLSPRAPLTACGSEGPNRAACSTSAWPASGCPSSSGAKDAQRLPPGPG